MHRVDSVHRSIRATIAQAVGNLAQERRVAQAIPSRYLNRGLVRAPCVVGAWDDKVELFHQVERDAAHTRNATFGGDGERSLIVAWACSGGGLDGAE